MRMMTGLPLVRSLADIVTLAMRGLTKSARGLKTAESRPSEHSSAGARGCDVRMFGCLPLDGPRAKAVCLPDCGGTCP